MVDFILASRDSFVPAREDNHIALWNRQTSSLGGSHRSPPSPKRVDPDHPRIGLSRDDGRESSLWRLTVVSFLPVATCCDLRRVAVAAVSLCNSARLMSLKYRSILLECDCR